MKLSFFVSGTPRSTQTGSVRRFTKRLRGGRTVELSAPTRRNAGWSDQFELVAKQHRQRAPIVGPVAVTMWVYTKRPGRWQPGCEHFPAVRPDGDNYAKGLFDRLGKTRGAVINDDGQIVEKNIRKRYADYYYPNDIISTSAEGVRVEIDTVTYRKGDA